MADHRRPEPGADAAAAAELETAPRRAREHARYEHEIAGATAAIARARLARAEVGDLRARLAPLLRPVILRA